MLTQDDHALIVFLSASKAGCSLDSSPGKNWVERSGGLPNYICKIAKAVMRSGKSKSAAIAIAISRVKKWAAGGDDVDADTRAKAAKAFAQWEALKAKNKAKQIVKASHPSGDGEVLVFLSTSYNLDDVRQAWSELDRARREAQREQDRMDGRDVDAGDYTPMPWTYVKELWNDHIIVESDFHRGERNYLKVPYAVMDGVVVFGEPKHVEMQYVETGEDVELSAVELALLEADLVEDPVSLRIRDIAATL